jgi:tetratricopeptide (TPR) repeat protein
LNPSFENLNNLGVIYYQTQDYPIAKEYFYQATLKQSKDNDSSTVLRNYAICLSRVGEKNRARVIAERLSVKDAYDIDDEDIAEIYYEIQDYNQVVTILENKKMFYPTYWASIYLFSLYQVGKLGRFESAFHQVIKTHQKEIIETNNDNSDWKQQDKEIYINELEEEMKEYKQTYEEIQNGKRPERNLNVIYLDVEDTIIQITLICNQRHFIYCLFNYRVLYFIRSKAIFLFK